MFAFGKIVFFVVLGSLFMVFEMVLLVFSRFSKYYISKTTKRLWKTYKTTIKCQKTTIKTVFAKRVQTFSYYYYCVVNLMGNRSSVEISNKSIVCTSLRVGIEKNMVFFRKHGFPFNFVSSIFLPTNVAMLASQKNVWYFSSNR